MTLCYQIKNNAHRISPLIVGDRQPKIIVITGATNEHQSLKDEIEKAMIATKYGASMVADVSTVGNIRAIHRGLLDNVDAPLCTVPIYEIHQRACSLDQWNIQLSKNLVLDVIEEQANAGVDCMTLHSSHKYEYIDILSKSMRRITVQARGGGLIHEFMIRTGRENPLYEHYDDILKIMKKHGVALSVGNCLRNGTIDDSLDNIILLETLTWVELVNRARRSGVNVMVEGLTHIKYGMILPYVRWLKTLCPDTPMRLLGPISTERGLGYDHITAAICATEAIRAGADLLTCVTRAEHIGIPDIDEIRESVVAVKIAIELATQSWEPGEPTTTFQCGMGFDNLRDCEMFDLEKAVELKLRKNHGDLSACSMCSEACRIRLNPKAQIRAPVNLLSR